MAATAAEAVAPPGHKALTLTHVRYQPRDKLAHFLAWVSLMPIFIFLSGFVSHVLFRWDLQAIFFAAGLLLSQLLNDLVKTSIQQARPATCPLLESCKSHSQYMFFFAAYFSLLSLLPRRHHGPLLALLLWPPAFLTLFSCVYLGYHSVSQVFAGALLGLVLGVAGFWLANFYVIRVPLIEDSAIGRFFYLKDCSHLPVGINQITKFSFQHTTM